MPETEPVTEEAFLADRQHFFKGFTHLLAGSVIVVAVVLVLMALTLVG